MTFFVTERGSGAAGGNFGGLSGADARCRAAAEAAGVRGKTWRAYLSANDDAVYHRVDARDRIGAGPWFDHAGRSIGDRDAIHATGIAHENILTECGRQIRYTDVLADGLTKHDIITGSDAEGRMIRDVNPNSGLRDGDPLTCNDWTSNAEAPYKTFVGHTDWQPPDQTWNSAHDTLGCSEPQLIQYVGTGGIYCFATN